MKLPVVEFGIPNQATLILDTWKKTQFLVPLEGVSPSLPSKLTYKQHSRLHLTKKYHHTAPPPSSFFFTIIRIFSLEKYVDRWMRMVQR